jgi:hypothetical protein
VGCGPSAAGLASSTGAGVGSAAAAFDALHDIVSKDVKGVGFNLSYLGPAVAAAEELGPESENRFEPSFFLSTVFILDNTLLIPFFSAGPSFAGVLMSAIVGSN